MNRKILARMIECGLTRRDCASYLGMSVSTFSKKANNPDLFSIGEAKKLSKYLDIGYVVFFANS